MDFNRYYCKNCVAEGKCMGTIKQKKLKKQFFVIQVILRQAIKNNATSPQSCYTPSFFFFQLRE